MTPHPCTYADFVRYVNLQRADNLLPQAFVADRRMSQQLKARAPAMSFGELQRCLLKLEEWGIQPAAVRSPADLVGGRREAAE